MKKKSLINFYKAYALWKDSIKDDSIYKQYVDSLNGVRSGESVLVGSVGSKILNLDWVERIEQALPYMDKAIRESRSFIEQRDEIVSIEKVKKINIQSVRHLAQHTNLIARVEANGDVKPEKILNIYYESSFAIYENRFLVTLLVKLVDFVEKRFQALNNGDEKIEVNFKINKKIKRKSKVAQMNMEFDYKTIPNDKFNVNDSTANMTGFERVVRIRSIIQDFYATPLIREQVNVERVIPPIRHTNLMTKNVNFRNCLELWDYISRYTAKGYTFEDKRFEGEIPSNIKNDLQDVFIFSNFLTEITFNTELKKNLKKEYKNKIKAENKKQRDKLTKFIKKVKKNVRAVEERKLKRKTNSLNKHLEQVKEQKEKLNKKYFVLKEKYQTLYDKTKRKYVRKTISPNVLEFEKEKEKLNRKNINIEKEDNQVKKQNVG